MKIIDDLNTNWINPEDIKKYMNKELVIEYHKPISGFVTVTLGSEEIIISMQEFDKLPADPSKRNEQLKNMF